MKMFNQRNSQKRDKNVLEQGSYQVEKVMMGGKASKIQEPQMKKWSETQISRYICYVEKNSSLLKNKDVGELWEEFKKMARYVETRNYRQCKIYHSKMVRQYQKIEHIIEALYESEEGLKEKVEKIKQMQMTVQAQQALKSNKGDDRPTNDDYAAEEPVPPIPLPSFLNQPGQNAQYFPPIMPAGMMSFQMPVPEFQHPNLQQEWAQCHQYLMEYLTRLSSLMNRER